MDIRMVYRDVYRHLLSDQLCINWANEKLQQLYIQHCIKVEQVESLRMHVCVRARLRGCVCVSTCGCERTHACALV